MRKRISRRRGASGRQIVIAEACEPRKLLSAIASDQTVTGTIAAPNQVDTYTFTVAAGQSVWAAAAETVAGPLTVSITLRAPDGSVVRQSASATGTSVLATDLTPAGTYSLNITGQSGTVGSYGVTLALAGVAPVGGTDAGPIASGAYRNATISAGDLDVHTISGTAGGSLLATIAPLTPVAGFQTQMIIFSPSGALLGNVAGASGTVSLVQNLPATGTYYVVAGDQLSDQTGDYAITVATFGGAQITDGDSGPISSGERRTGTIDPGDFDVYTIAANAGGSLFGAVGTPSPTAGFQTQMLIFSPTGALLGNVSGSTGTNSLVQNLSATGTYYVAVLDQLGDHTGTYAVSVARFGGGHTVSTGDEGGPVASGEYRRGAVSPGDFDVYTLAASAGQTLVAAMGDLSSIGEFQPQLLVFSPTGALLGNNAGSSGASVLLPDLPVTGTYSIVALDQLGDDNGNYGLSALRVGAGATQTVSPGDEGGPLTSGERRAGKIAPGDIDSFTFNLALGNAALWNLGETIENSFAPRLLILDPAGVVLFNSVGTHGRAYSLPTAATAGTYTALVLASTGGVAGEYALTGVAVPATQAPDDDGGTLAPGQPRAGAIRPGDADVFTVTAIAGQNLTFNLSKTGTGSLTPLLIVYGPNGTIAGSNAGSAAHVTINSALAGAYTALVTDLNGEGSGAYSIGLNTPAGTDTFAPKLLEAAYRYNDRPAVLKLAFSEDVSASFQPDQFVLKNLTTGQTVNPADLAISFTHFANEIDFNFSPLPGGTLPDGNYRLIIPAADLSDVAGNPLGQDVSLDFFVLTGDVNHDRSVNFTDLLTLAQNYGGTGKTFSQGDLNYDGRVDFTDLLSLAQNYGKTLPPPAAATAAATDWGSQFPALVPKSKSRARTAAALLR